MVCVAASCSVLQCVAANWGAVRSRSFIMVVCVAACCSVLQCVAASLWVTRARSFIMVCVAASCSVLKQVGGFSFKEFRYGMWCSSVLQQCVAMCCSVLQHGVLYCVASCCNSVLQHSVDRPSSCIMVFWAYAHANGPRHLHEKLIETTPPPLGGFPIYYFPSSRTVSKRTPLEGPGTNSSRGSLLLTVLDEGT